MAVCTLPYRSQAVSGLVCGGFQAEAQIDALGQPAYPPSPHRAPAAVSRKRPRLALRSIVRHGLNPSSVHAHRPLHRQSPAACVHDRVREPGRAHVRGRRLHEHRGIHRPCPGGGRSGSGVGGLLRLPADLLFRRHQSGDLPGQRHVCAVVAGAAQRAHGTARGRCDPLAHRPSGAGLRSRGEPAGHGQPGDRAAADTPEPFTQRAGSPRRRRPPVRCPL